MQKLTDLTSIAEWIGISCALFHNNGLQIVLLLSHNCKLYWWIFYFQLCGNAILKLLVINWRPKVNSVILTFSMRNLSVTSLLIFLFSLRNFTIYLI